MSAGNLTIGELDAMAPFQTSVYDRGGKEWQKGNLIHDPWFHSDERAKVQRKPELADDFKGIADDYYAKLMEE